MAHALTRCPPNRGKAKVKLILMFGCVWFSLARLFGQGTLVYDQQSSTESNLGGGVWQIQSQPMGQSFTPSLSSVGFVRLYLSDSSFDGLGATVYLYLESGSINGSVLATSDPITVADRFHGLVDFIFSTPATVNPGETYYLQPTIQSGGPFGVYAYNTFNYLGGTAFSSGSALPNIDFWFREGIIVPAPEPATVWLGLLGSGVLVFRVWRRKARV